MKVSFARTFSRDLRRIRDKAMLNRVKAVIEQYEQLDTLVGARQLRKLKGEDTTTEFESVIIASV